MNIFVNKLAAVPTLNYSRGRCASVADIIGAAQLKEADVAGLISSLADGWQAQDNSCHVVPLTADKRGEVIDSLREQAAYWLSQGADVLQYNTARNVDPDDVTESGKGEKITITKRDILLEFIDLNFKAVKEGDESVTALVKEIRIAAGLSDDNKQYDISATYIVANCNRRVILAPAVAVLNKVRYAEGDNRGMLRITSADEIPSLPDGGVNWAAFTSLNYVENAPKEVGRKRIRAVGERFAAYNFFLAGMSHADYGKRDKVNPYRFNLISVRTGENDSSAMIRVYMFAKCAASFPDTGLLEAYTAEDDKGNTIAYPGNKELTLLQATISGLLEKAGFCNDTGAKWATMRYGAISARLPQFLAEHPEVKQEAESAIRRCFKLTLTPEEEEAAAAKEAAQLEKKKQEAARPSVDKVTELNTGLPEPVQTLLAYCVTGRNSEAAEKVLDCIRRNADQFNALFKACGI